MITLGVYVPEQGAVGAVLRTRSKPGIGVICLSDEPMNQAIFFANSALRSWIDRAAGGAPECMPFFFILPSFRSKHSSSVSGDANAKSRYQENQAKDRQNQDNGPRLLLPRLDEERE